MEALGYIFLVVIALAILMAFIVLVAAAPDISRYRRLRRM